MNKIKERAKPYLYEAGDKLVILVHGFSGTPDDMRELAKFLASKGYSAKALLLAGHGSNNWWELAGTSYYDWWKSVEEELMVTAEKYRKVYLVGYSFGANLAFDLAARYPHLIDGLVSLGISVYLKNEFFIKLLLPFFHLFLKRYQKSYIKKKYVDDYLDSGSYLCIPTKSVYDFYDFINFYTKKELARVTVPALLIHSRDDAITHPKSSEFVHSRISSERKELLILDEMNHNPISSQRKNLIFSKIEEFLNSL